MSENIEIQNRDYFQQIVQEFKNACKNGTFDLVRNYKSVMYENENVNLVKSVQSLVSENDFKKEEFVVNLYKIFRIINKNFWGLNFLNLGFKQEKIDEKYGDYEKNYYSTDKLN